MKRVQGTIDHPVHGIMSGLVRFDFCPGRPTFPRWFYVTGHSEPDFMGGLEFDPFLVFSSLQSLGFPKVFR